MKVSFNDLMESFSKMTIKELLEFEVKLSAYGFCKGVNHAMNVQKLATLKEVLKEAQELKHFNEVAEQEKYPEWLRGYNTAVDSIIEYCNTKIKEVEK